ncbi:archease [bacterium]|nr:archease [bacterium]
MKEKIQFKILPHPADLKIEVFGSSKKELFQNAMIAMFRAAGFVGEGQKTKRKLICEGMDLPSLLVAFLEEVLYLSEIHNEVYWRVKFKEFSDEEIKAEVIGEPIREKETIIKGVTFYELDIKKEKSGKLKATILFDV